MSNFLAEVIQARDATAGDEFREMLESVDSQLTTLKSDLVESLESCFVLYDSDIDRATMWYVEVLGIHDKVQELEKQFNDDQKALQAAQDDVENLSYSLEICNRNVNVLRSLVEVVRSIENADSSDYFRASKLVKTASGNFKAILDSFSSSEDKGWVKGIRGTINDLTVEIYEKASNEFWSAVKFEKNSMHVNRHRCNFGELIEALSNIGYSSRVFNKFRVHLWEEILSQACSPEFVIEFVNDGFLDGIETSGESEVIPVRDSDPQPKLSRRSSQRLLERGNIVSVFAKKTSRPITHVEVILNRITDIITLVNSLFQVDESTMAEMASALSDKICEELKCTAIKTLVLRNPTADVEQARNNVAIMQAFRDNLTSQMNFEFPQGSIFDDLAENFDSLFISQVRQDVLVKIRNLIKSRLHDTEEITYPNKEPFTSSEEYAALQRNPYIFPKCVVSKSVADIVRVLNDHLSRNPDDVTMPDAALNLYIALVKVPKHEAEAGDLVPFCAVMIHNNSYYLAHQACFNFPMCEEKVPELRAKASQAYSFMMRSVRSSLNYLISEAMGGMTNEDVSEEEVDKFMKISSEFIRLDGLFRPILPPAILKKTLATLVDHTVNEMCSKVLSWEDISANSANVLASAFSQFAIETSELFKGEAKNPREMEAVTAQCVSKWIRFKSLTFVLTASMQEIKDRWVDGCGPLAEDFKPDELRKLIRALFQNTDRRAAFLASIK